ncbi:MAG: SAM-dependent methyltransferase [Alphaproteobacteria bacterium]
MSEIGPPTRQIGRLYFSPGPPKPVAWAANVWRDPVAIPFASIGEAATALRAIQRNWCLYSAMLHRRSALIQSRLPVVSAKPLAFPAPAPSAPLGSWTLLKPGLLVAAARCSSPFPNGEPKFVEDKSGPPNRAYLKLWEALTLADRRPGPGETCLDLGASPGGWTYALARLGARVIAVDKAPLAPAVAANPLVSTRLTSAFALAPADIGPVDWLFSDIVCYPMRLYRLIRTWLDSGLARNIVCTIKFQGETDRAAQAAFAALPGGQLIHLHHNKHELTWMRLAQPQPSP